MIKQISRRTLLRGAGGAAIALPFLDLMRPQSVLASGGGSGPPQRLFIYVSPNGVISDLWFPDPASAGTQNFTLSPMLAPLERHRDDLNILLGVDNIVTFGGHFRGQCSLLSGVEPVGTDTDTLAGGITVDQYIGQRLAENPETATPFSTLTTGSTHKHQLGVQALSYAGPGTPVPKKKKAETVFNDLFGSGDIEAAARRRALQQSVLDHVSDDVSRLQAKLGAADRQRLDQHLTSIREVERRINSISHCDPGGFVPGTTTDHSAKLPEMIEEMMDVLALAFACDLTRVSTYQIRTEGATSAYTFGWLGVGPEGDPYAHDTTDDQNSTSHHSMSHYDWTDRNRDYLTRVNAFFMEEMAYFIDKLKAIPEGGGTVFDNSILAYSSPLARGNHKGNDIPWLLAGSGGGVLKTGQYLNLRTDNATDFPSGNRSSHYRGVSHNDVLVSLVNAMGIEDSTFGAVDKCNGPLSDSFA